MNLANLDSRIYSGTDIKQKAYPHSSLFKESSSFAESVQIKQNIRVFQGNLGSLVRLSAPMIDIVVEGDNFQDAWINFLDEVRKRDDSIWLTFDVGPTREEDIAKGLNAPEFEDWSEPFDGNGE